MSKILSYSNKTAKDGIDDWIEVEPYSSDDISQIRDPNGGLSEYPRTAIPSPFAQLDLVKNAFQNLANPGLRGAVMDERLVSNALDVAQLFFDYENHKDYLRIVRWNQQTEIEALKSSPSHRLYGQTLELFLNSDRIYNFEFMPDWYILMRDNQAIGSTSPASLFMAAPLGKAVDVIKVEQGVSLFSSVRHLWQRDADFVYCAFLLMNAYPQLRERVGNVYAYMLSNLDRLRQERPQLYERIISVIPNPSALNREAAAGVQQTLEATFDAFAGDNEVSVMGARLFHRRALAIKQNAGESDFVIAPTIEQPQGEQLPLVLRNNFNGAVDHYRYIDKEWDSSTQVYAGNVPVQQRHLPDTSIQYPFLTTADFLTDTLVQLPGPIDGDHYFDGNAASKAGAPVHGYLLPLKPAVFKYFKASDVAGAVLGRNFLDIEEQADGSVVVTLRIPVKKKHIELSRRYFATADAGWTFDEARGTGRIVPAIMSASVFPFVRTASHDDYTVQLFTMLQGGTAKLRFLTDGMESASLNVTSKDRTKASYATTYYDVNGSFDFIEASVAVDASTLTGVIIPKWKPYRAGTRQLLFAVDFGTTNTHVEWAERGHNSQPLTFSWNGAATLIAPLLKRGALLIAEQLQSIEFLPSEINDLYGFPLRTAMARNINDEGGNQLFADVNIPFLYERRYFSGYDITTSLKWRGDTTLSREFLREIMFLVKAKALLENADPSKTEVIYFFPVSMGGSDRRKLQDTWEELYRTYMGQDTSLLRVYPESIAPAFYYKGADVAGSSFASIDIGGGTTDMVVYQPTPDRMDSQPVAISSFRFAGNAIFGDAFTSKDADSNPLIAHYATYFQKLVTGGNDTAYLNNILADIMKGKRSEDINAFMFSIENVEQVRSRRETDRNLYSYNMLLRNDDTRKIIFVYFYAAIIYYLASLMKLRGFEMPKQLYFSGTGSKILNILGSRQQVNELTQTIIERVYGDRYNEQFDIKIEQDCPKQVTCRGGVKLENERLEGLASVSQYTPRNINAIKYCYSMIGEQHLTLSKVEALDTRSSIVASVKQFNQFFITLCDKVMRDEFGITNATFNTFASVVDNDLDNYLTAGIKCYLQGRYDEGDEIEDAPFFYPIIGAIRYNLLSNLHDPGAKAQA